MSSRWQMKRNTNNRLMTQLASRTKSSVDGSSSARAEENEKGATMLEYMLMAALVAIVCIAAITFLGQETSEMFSTLGSGFAAAN